MNTQKISTEASHKTQTKFNINNYISAIQARYQSQVSQSAVERKPKSNKLLFGLTVVTLTGIMGGTIFLAINQYQPQKTSIIPLNNFSDNQIKN